MKVTSAPRGVLDVSKYVVGCMGGGGGGIKFGLIMGGGGGVAMSRPEKLEEESGLEAAKIVFVVFLLISRVFALAFLGTTV